MKKGFIILLLLSSTLLATMVEAREKTSWTFNFGGSASSNSIPVSPSDLYSDSTGYGFESTTNLTTGNSCITSTNPFYFSVKLPEDNYRVTVTLGDKTYPSTTTVKAELRRLMLYHIQTETGQFITRSFIVNLRTPEITGNDHVHLKPREKTTEWRDWDGKLTLEFNDATPCVSSLTIEKADVPTVFIIGDSTVCDQPLPPWNSWGQMLPIFFQPDIAIGNHAESGETIADSLAGNRFKKIFSLMKPGDYLLIQFGHNDMKSKKPDALELYKSNLKEVVTETHSKGGTPILITSMERKAGIDHPTLEGYPDAVREVAREEHCPLIDLNAMSIPFYKALGTNLGLAFVDGTHHDNYGSYELAKCIVTAIQKSDPPLAQYISPDFKDFNPANPDPVSTFYMPDSTEHSNVKPLGN